MDFISLLVLAFSSAFCIIYRNSVNEVLLAMLLTYILLLQDYILWTVKCVSMIEARMVNVDRCFKILTIP